MIGRIEDAVMAYATFMIAMLLAVFVTCCAAGVVGFAALAVLSLAGVTP